MRTRLTSTAVLLIVFAGAGLPAEADGLFGRAARNGPSNDPPLISWQPPATWTPSNPGFKALSRTGFSGTAFSDLSGPLPFIPITACRQYNSHTPTPTPLLQATPRAVTLSGGACGIPTGAQAVAVNITVFNITGASGNGVFKVGNVSPPPTAWINYPSTETQRANAGVVPVDTNAVLYVQVNQGAGSVDFTVDVFGYYSVTPANQNNWFEVDNNSGHATIQAVNSSAFCGNQCGISSLVASGWALYGENQTPAATGAVGVYGKVSSTADDSAGVSGLSEGLSGRSYGVLGSNSSVSNDSAGVRGVDGTGTPASSISYVSAGVRGDSKTALGVLGVSQHLGVAAVLTNSGGSVLAEGYLASNVGVSSDSTTGPWGVFAAGNLGASGAKHFVEPHATDASKVIVYSSLEGREVGTYFRGTARASGGRAIIEIPEDFRTVTDDEGLTVQLTPVGGWSQMYVETQDLNQIVVRSSADVTFHYLVQGVRRAFKDFTPVGKGYEYMPRSADARMPGYLTEEAKRRLIQNGTYNADGTVNMSTAERVGWTEVWRQREEQIKAAVAEESARRAAARLSNEQQK